MTSSFSLPGGNTVAVFRAEAVDGLQTSEGMSTTRIQSHLKWVLLKRGTLADAPVPNPPSREADYAGQIIAVATPVAPLI
jgi:hypothetical protein